MTTLSYLLTRRMASFVFLLWACLAVAPGQAAPLDFQIQLVWGTNGEKPADRPLKPVNPNLEERLKGVFKWKNYFEVTSKPLSVPENGVQKIQLSKKCDVEVRDLGGSNVEVRLFGEGQLVRKVKQAVTPGQLMVIAGDDKNDTAWFVVLSPK
jgi:hypothetical protein